MNDERRRTIQFGGVLVLLGLLLNVWMYFSGGWPTSFFLVLMGLGLLIMLLGVLIRRHTTWAALGVFVTFWVILYAFVGRERQWTYELAWDGAGPPVVLTFRDYPDYYVEIKSPKLAQHLQSLQTRHVRGLFKVTTSFGKVTANQGVVIGDSSYWYYFGRHRDAKGGPPPWK